MAKLDVKALGLSFGIMWGAAMLIMGLLARQFGYGAGFVRAIGTLYIGYSASIKGSLIGTAYGFVDAGIGGVIIAWLYNKLSK